MMPTFENRDGILFAVFSETVTEENLRSLAAEIENVEKDYTVLTNRVVDLCKVKSFDANFMSVLSLAENRNRKVFPTHIKTALLVSNNYQLGFARMYQTFIENPQMSINIFTDESKALEWLKSPDTRLTSRPS